MGLLESMPEVRRGGRLSELGPAEAFAAIAMISVAADGYVDELEINNLTNIISRMQLFRSYPSDVLSRLLDKLGATLQKHGSNALLESAVLALPEELRETAFAVVTDIVLADGEITEEEEDLLNKLYEELDLTKEKALTIIQVMLIKNKG
jgi:uncharacterized tellurite resistance protein B-like protein